MKRAALCLLTLLVLVPTAALADSLDSITPSSFYSFEFEQNATLHGVNLFGDFFGAPDQNNIFLSTHVVVEGPAGTFMEDISGGFRTPNTFNDTIFISIPDSTLLVEGHYSVTVIATDDVGPRSIGPVFYDVVSRPVQQNPLLSIPENVIAEATSASGAIVTFSVSGFSFVDPAPTVVCNHTSGSQFPVGSTTVTCTATDSFGATSGSFEVNVTDTVAPVLHVPATIISSNPVVTFTVTATDNVDSNPLVTCSPASGSTFSVGSTTVLCSAIDAHANRVFGSFKITVTGGPTAPTLTVPDDITAEATSAAGAIVTFNATATDNATVSCSPASGAAFPLGPTTVSCSATSAGGTSTDAFKITVVDTTAPELSLPGTINVGATSPAGAVVTYSATATDLVDGSRQVFCDPPSGATFPIGTTVVQCSSVDTQINVASGAFMVVVSSDSTPPVLSLPANITTEATSASGAVVTFTATANDDDVDGPVPVSCDHASGSTFPIGTTTVQCSAIDAHNNASNGSFTVTVRDTTPPVLSLPANITKEATSASGASATYTASASDLVDGSVPVSCDHASGSTFPIGTTTVQCNAIDAHNNIGTGSFLVTVRDTTPPVLSLPANITAEATSASGAAVSYTASSSDIVDGSVPVLCDHASGSTFPLGTTTVQCTATDAHNNTAHGSFTVLVQDTTAPIIVSITASPNNLWPPNHTMVNVSVTVIATDAVDPAPTSHIVSVTSNQPINGTGDGDTSPDWQITGALTLQLRAERAGGTVRIYTITIATTDAGGNTSNGTVTVSVGDGRGRAVH
jgi:HYR domain.